ncbi:hypothetical protein QJS10_CPA09g00373 [Acorus calamus]|uniref:Uncharacterized protein n=1 Tax=Acorus calamus TaxID=4465 RepID=A0AAV9E2I2_ACOCL|nr:hypothetical protein QJS10_CPA09g00373 [Acorus calamus]
MDPSIHSMQLRPSPSILSPSKDWEKKLRRCAEAAAKGFAIGSGLKGGLAVFSILVRLRSRRSSASKARSGELMEKESLG